MKKIKKMATVIQLVVLLGGSVPMSLSAAAALKSDLTQGGLFYGKVELGQQVIFKGQTVRTSADGRFILGFGRDDELTQTYMLVDKQGRTKTITLSLQPRDYNIQKIKGVAKKYVDISQAALQRIKLDNTKVNIARTKDTSLNDFFHGFSWPLTGPITGVYGSQRFFNGQPRRPHFGVDIAAVVGTKVSSPADGQVSLAEGDLYFSGGTLIIDHGYGLSSSFLHLSKILVKEGQKVKRGDIIAEVGATGRVTGAHLDWRINWFQKRLDPQLLAGRMK